MGQALVMQAGLGMVPKPAFFVDMSRQLLDIESMATCQVPGIYGYLAEKFDGKREMI
jgi:hypothetical protein